MHFWLTLLVLASSLAGSIASQEHSKSSLALQVVVRAHEAQLGANDESLQLLFVRFSGGEYWHYLFHGPSGKCNIT